MVFPFVSKKKGRKKQVETHFLWKDATLIVVVLGQKISNSWINKRILQFYNFPTNH